MIALLEASAVDADLYRLFARAKLQQRGVMNKNGQPVIADTDEIFAEFRKHNPDFKPGPTDKMQETLAATVAFAKREQ